MRKILIYLKNWLYNSYYYFIFRLRYEREPILVKDLLCSENITKLHHLLVALWHVAVENYYNINNDGFGL